MFADEIAVRNNIIVFFLKSSGKRRCAATVFVVQLMEVIFCIWIERRNTLTVSRINNHIDFIGVWIAFFRVLTTIRDSDAFIIKFCFGKSELPIQIGICGRVQVVNGVIINAFTKNIKHLCVQPKLHHFLSQFRVIPVWFQSLYVVMNHTNNIGHDFIVSTSIDLRLAKQVRQRKQRMKVIVNAHTSDIICQ